MLEKKLFSITSEDLERETWNTFWFKRKRTLFGRLLFYVRRKYLCGAFTVVAKRYVKKGDSVLEIGCGSALSTILLKKTINDIKIFGLDFDYGALEIASTLAEKREVDLKLIQADLRAMPLKRKAVDIIWSIGTLEHFKYPQEILISLSNLSSITITIVPQRSISWITFLRIAQLLSRGETGYMKLYSREEFAELYSQCHFAKSQIFSVRILGGVFSYLTGVTHNI